MSSEHISYVGPYVVAKCGSTNKSQAIVTCTNNGCEKHGKALNSRFCDECGSGVEKVQIPSERPSVDPWEMQCDVLDESMRFTPENVTLNGTIYWRSNLVTLDEKVGRKTDVGDEEVALEITPDRIALEKNAFLELHGNDIEKLRAAYDEISVIWGILAQWK